MSPLGPRGPGAGTRQAVEAGGCGARQSWGYLPLFSLSRAAGELEAGGDYVKVRDRAGRHGGQGAQSLFHEGQNPPLSLVRSQISRSVPRRRGFGGEDSAWGLLSPPASSSRAFHHSPLAPYSGHPDARHQQVPPPCQLDRAQGCLYARTVVLIAPSL